MPEYDKQCESFTVSSIDSVLVCGNKYQLEVYLDNCAFKIANEKTTDYLEDNLFEHWILEILYYDKSDKKKGIDFAKSNFKNVKKKDFSLLVL